MSNPENSGYGLSAHQSIGAAVAPDLSYLPPSPRAYSPGIGLVGCGGISEYHLKAYRHAGYRVVALCDRTLEKAVRRQREFYPHATVHSDHHALLADPAIEVVDIAT